MVKLSQLLGLATALGLLVVPCLASASESLNPSLGRLVLDHNCNAEGAGDGSNAAYLNAQGNLRNVGRFNDQHPEVLDELYRRTGRRSCAPDSIAFKKLINQWGFALAPSAMHTARTTGFGGFHFSLEAMYTKISSDADYWKLGSQGPRLSSSDGAATANGGPPGIIQQYSLRIRKSFGFGFEVGGQVGYVPSSTIFTGGADVRLSLLEGFRTGLGGIFPDVAVGGGVRTITGTPEFQLTTVGLDVQVSKPLTLGSQSTLTPWVGYQYLWIFGDSGLIDTTPATDPVGYCQFSGLKDPSSKGGPPYTGQPVCAGGASPADFNNNVVFQQARLERQRMMFGLDYRYEMVSVGAQFITDIVAPADAQTGGNITTVPTGPGTSKKIKDSDALKDEERQWTLVFQVGAMF